MDQKINEIYPVFLSHPLVTTDSRQVTPGSLFFALKGDSYNGNEFAAGAIAAGAAFAVVDDPQAATSASYILVDDVLETLQSLARHHRSQFSIPVIAITGTNGKTTTKELINCVLSARYKTLATRGNLNNHIGVPLTLLNMSAETEIAIIEMGANHPGEIDFLCRIAQPGFGLITNIGKAHLAGFGSYEGVIATKTELYRYIRECGGEIFLNSDDNLLSAHAAGLKAIIYGQSEADLTATNISADPYVNMDMHFPGGFSAKIESKLYGSYNAGNILAAACIGLRFGVSPEAIKKAVEEYQPGNNRSQITRTGHNLLILDAYNANPSSMKVALENFAASSFAGKVVILGDMLELGADSDQEHLEILKLVDRSEFSQVYLVGPDFTRLNTKRENICFQDSELAKLWLEHQQIENSTVLIKGSRGIRLEKLADSL
ncbi:MAG: UDP-N-acetylmuramoyl-tripeptide--D-alanyl-D-alanine ligase [bacterium]